MGNGNVTLPLKFKFHRVPILPGVCKWSGRKGGGMPGAFMGE